MPEHREYQILAKNLLNSVEKQELNLHHFQDRYHVLQYDEEPDFSEKLVWEKSCIKTDEIKEILTGLQVESEYIPDLQSSDNVKYYHNTKNDDELWMIYNRDQQRLYIIERLI